MSRSDGSTADYYVLPEAATQLQDLISHRDMNSQIGEIFRACYRYGIVSHSDKMRDAKKIRFYAQAEVERLEKLSKAETSHSMEYFEKCIVPAEQPSHIISDIWKDAPDDATCYTPESEDYHAAFWKEVDGKFVGCWVDGHYYKGNTEPEPERRQYRPTSTAQ